MRAFHHPDHAPQQDRRVCRPAPARDRPTLVVREGGRALDAVRPCLDAALDGLPEADAA